MNERRAAYERFQKLEGEIIAWVDVDSDYDAVDHITRVLEANSDLSPQMIAEIMLSVFKAGKKAGKYEFKAEIAKL